jgi:hypothetical protein
MIKNALRFAGKASYKNVDSIKKEMRDYIISHQAEEVGRCITLIHSAKPGIGILDAEILVPINKPIPSSKKFKYISNPTIKGCIMSKYRGHYLPSQAEDEELKQEALGLIADL